MNRLLLSSLLVLVLLSASAASAQEVTTPPPQPLLPEAAPAAPPASTAESTWPPTVAQPAATAPPVAQPTAAPAAAAYVPGQTVYTPDGPYVLVPARPAYPAMPLWQPQPSPNIGLTPGPNGPHWDIAVDALWLDRDVGNEKFLGATNYDLGYHGHHGYGGDELWTDDQFLTLEPGLRLQLVGRIDDRTAIETICWGLQQWSVNRMIFGNAPDATILARTPWLQTSAAIGGFDDYLRYQYESQVANVEFNQRIKFYNPDPYRALSWMWGFRYFFLSDDFSLSGSDLKFHDTERLRWRTTNNLIGGQLGLQWAWGWDRFQLTTELKGGLYANPYWQHGTDSATGTAPVDQFDVSHSATSLAAIIEFSIGVRYRLTDCMWLRAAYQYDCVAGLALGPRQLGGYNSNGAVGMDGLLLGLEIAR
jgi:hypothetical protein